MNLQASSSVLDATLRDFVAGQKLFNRYSLKRILGRGGMGVVWLAQDDVLEREVALKFLPELLIYDRAKLSDLKRETNRSLELTHKNIVRIYDFVHNETGACISMEYVDGDTLSNIRVDRPRKVFECWELGNWTNQLCDALDYAHNHARVVHRDLKPSNLMVNLRGDLKVADFGIARSLSDSVSMLTMGHHTSGTLVYMSPQQLDGGRGTPLDDIYSFGATMYELLTSKPPFYSGNIDRQIHERIPPPMSFRREELDIVGGEPIDPLWEEVVAACLQKDPAHRPQSALDIVQLLTAPAPKSSYKISDWLSFPARKADQKTGLRPAPPSTKTRPPTVATQPKRESTHRIRRAGLALLAGGTAIARGFANGSTAVGNTFQEIDAKIIEATRAIFRGVALGAISATKAIIRGVGQVLVATGTGISKAAPAVATVCRNIVLGVGRAFLLLTKETVRGAAIVVIPAAVVGLGIWYFAIRTPPPPREVVAQPLPKMETNQPSTVQAAASPGESHIALVAPIPAPVTRPPESKPAPPPEGGLQIETAPSGAKVTIDGSLVKTSPATLSNLAVGKHHLQIELSDYVSEERDVEIKAGEVATQGVIKLHARTPPQPVATPRAAQQAAIAPTHKESEQKVAATKKPARSKQPAPPAENASLPMTHQAAVGPSPSMAKPTPPRPRPSVAPEKPVLPFQGTAPGG